MRPIFASRKLHQCERWQKRGGAETGANAQLWLLAHSTLYNLVDFVCT